MPNQVEAIRTQRELAKIVKRSASRVSRWITRDDWPFGGAPWPRAKAPEILRWAAEHLDERNDREPVCGDPAAESAAGVDDGFFALRGDYPETPAVLAADGISLESTPLLPAAVVGDFERAILTGRVALTAAEAAEVVDLFARFRARMIEMCDALPGWLVGRDRREISRRLRSEVLDRCAWIGSAIAGVDDRRREIERDDNGDVVPHSKPAGRRAGNHTLTAGSNNAGKENA